MTVSVVLAVPLLAIAGLAMVLVALDGGFRPTTWYPVGLIAVGILAVVLFAVPTRRRPLCGASRAAVLALAAYTAWCFLSIGWAGVKGDAWQGANLTLVYFVVFCVPVFARVRVAAAAWTLLSVVGVVSFFGFLAVWNGAHSPDPNAAVLFGGRLAEPSGYPNATAALYMMAFWVGLGLALTPALLRPMRALALGLAGVSGDLVLLAQSRGAVFTFPFVVIVFLLATPRRLRGMAVFAIVACAVLIGMPTLSRVFRSPDAQTARTGLSNSTAVLAITFIGLALIGLGLPYLDRLPSLTQRARRLVRVAVAFGLCVVVIGALAVSTPAAEGRRAWNSFRSTEIPGGASHFSGLGSNRYDFWRVGLTEFRTNPVTGIGLDNFSVPYLQQRRSDEQPLYPHSLWVRTLSQVGLVGTALLILFFVAAATAALRRRTSTERDLAAAAIVGAAAWLAHAQVDWLWEMPMLGVLAFLLLGIAVSLPRTTSDAAIVRSGGTWVPSLGVALVCLAVTSLGAPWLASLYQTSATKIWRADRASASDQLRKAAALDPLGDSAYVLRGAIAGRFNDYGEMAWNFQHAVERNPFNWYAQLELAVAASAMGNHELAVRASGVALRLNPREPLVREVVDRIEREAPMTPAEVDAAVLESPDP